jgi:rod shape-determining protein MreB
MNFFRGLRRSFACDLAIDLGTANTLIYRRGEGIVCNEPSVVAVQMAHNGKKRVVAVGIEAKNMLGRTPESIVAVRPMREGVIADYEITEEMLKALIRKVNGGRSFVKPKIVICVPHAVTEIEKRAVRDSAIAAGAREVYLIEEPMAAALGSGLPIAEPCGSMILDIGGGTTEIAIISLKGIVFSRSLRVGGDKLDEAITNYVRRKYNLLIGEASAERMKIAIGSVAATGDNLSMEVRGRDVIQGVPKTALVTENEIRDSILEPVNQIVDVVRTALEKTPPELASDIMERGITMTGGGSLLKSLDKLITKETDIPVSVVDDPLASVVNGSGMVLERFEALRGVILQ